MALGTTDKEPRGGLYSAANAGLAQPFQTSPSAASRATSAKMDQQLRGMRNEAGMNDVREFSNRLRARVETLSAAARAAGDQAAAALNAVHASAQVAVQGETA